MNRIIICAFIVIALAPAAIFAEEAATPEWLDFEERLEAGRILADPADWDDETREEFFGHMPPEYREDFLSVYGKLREANGSYWKSRAELFKTIHPVFTDDEDEEIFQDYADGDYAKASQRREKDYAAGYLVHVNRAFRRYPSLYDPAGETEYWESLAAEIVYLYDMIGMEFRNMTAKQDRQAGDFAPRIDRMTRAELPDELQDVFGFQFAFIRDPLPLNEEQKSRILRDEPLFPYDSFDSWLFPKFAAREYLEEQRKAELEKWKIDETPELSKLGVTQAGVDRWDGSLSLHPLIRNIAGRLKSIGLIKLETTVEHGSLPDRIDTTKTLSNTHPAIMALFQGRKDLVFSARKPSEDERLAAEEQGVKLVCVPFAKDAFVFLQNRHNPVRNLTLKQYQGIFSGQYRHWKDLGGFGGTVTPFIRNEHSGSEELMQTMVMHDIAIHKDFNPRKLSGMYRVFSVLEYNHAAIAYSIFHYDRYMVFSPISRTMSVDGTSPSLETIESGKYPLIYEPVLIHRENPNEKVRKFADWLLSDEGQRVVRASGYVPIRPVP